MIVDAWNSTWGSRPVWNSSSRSVSTCSDLIHLSSSTGAVFQHAETRDRDDDRTGRAAGLGGGGRAAGQRRARQLRARRVRRLRRGALVGGPARSRPLEPARGPRRGRTGDRRLPGRHRPGPARRPALHLRRRGRRQLAGAARAIRPAGDLPQPSARRRRRRPRFGGCLRRLRGAAGGRAQAPGRAGAGVRPRLARADPRRPRRGGRRSQDQPPLRRYRRRLGLRAGRGRAGAGDPADALEQRPGPRRGGGRRGDPERPRPARLPGGEGRRADGAAALPPRPQRRRQLGALPARVGRGRRRPHDLRPAAARDHPSPGAGEAARLGRRARLARALHEARRRGLEGSDEGGRPPAADDRRLRHQRARR